MKRASLLITTSMFLAAIAFNMVEMPRAVAQTKGHCSDYIAYRNSTFDAERRVKSEISGFQREIADAKSPNSGNLDKKVADAMALVQTIRRTIADLEARSSPNTELSAILEFHKKVLPKAARLLAGKTNTSSGGGHRCDSGTLFVCE